MEAGKSNLRHNNLRRVITKPLCSKSDLEVSKSNVDALLHFGLIEKITKSLCITSTRRSLMHLAFKIELHQPIIHNQMGRMSTDYTVNERLSKYCYDIQDDLVDYKLTTHPPTQPCQTDL